MKGDDFFSRFPRSGPPRTVKGGIRARTRKGAFGRSWWARRWITVLEALQLGGRLARGRSYARRGQVMDVQVEPGLVRARVQGTSKEPYDVVLEVTPLPPRDWRALARVLSREAAFLARLLAGEMPADIETAFGKAGLSLFPVRLAELQTSCSCPDPSNPCKHIAAVYYLLGEEFDRDPFLIFALRGTSRDDLLRLVEELDASPRRARAGGRPRAIRARETSPPPAANGSFWRAAEIPPDDWPEPAAGQAGALLTRLGAFPFWRGAEPLPEALLPTYESASGAALELLAALAPKTKA